MPYLSLLSSGLMFVFTLVVGFIGWMKFSEHLNLHRHEYGPHGSQTHPARRARRRSE